MEMKKLFYIFASLLGGLILLAGCQKDGKLFDKSNGQFRFGVSSKVLTRTEYGKTADKHQDINWTADDQIRIYSPTAARRVGVEKGLAEAERYYWADYKIIPDKNVPTNKATLENLINDGNGKGNGLAWERGKESDEHKFYAVYPKPELDPEEEEGKGAKLDGCAGKLTMDIPEIQKYSEAGNMEYAYMTAYAQGKGTASEINLDFYPAFTAFEIDLGTVDAESYVNTFKMEAGTPIAGIYTATYDAEKADWIYTPSTVEGETSNIVSVAFPQGTTIAPAQTSGEETVKAKRIRFTVFTIGTPVTNPKITFTGSIVKTGTEINRSLVLKKATENLTFAGCHKHRINGLLLPGEEPSSISVTVEMDKTKMDWYDGVYSEMVSEDYPQASQFTVTNAINKRDGGKDSDNTDVAGTNNKADRQTWYFKKDKKAINVDFNVTSPTNGTWTIEAMGDKDVFTISGSYTKYTTTDGTPTGEEVSLSGTSISGSINEGHPTKISLQITPGESAASGNQLYFKTYVTNTDGKKISLDSETQLYDMRGYHYFVIR